MEKKLRHSDENNAPAPWPPRYTVRLSARAARCALRLLPAEGLEVVIPSGKRQGQKAALPGSFELKLAEELVERYKPWILRKQKNLLGLQKEREAAQSFVPHSIDLHGGRLKLDLEWSPRPVLFEIPQTGAKALPLYARGEGPERRKDAVRLWLDKYARAFLPPLLRETAAAHGLSFSKVNIRRQKTRWGSCSAKACISLNAKLVFLPDEMARAVMLHELCHTRHLNHSQDFWTFFSSLDPGAVRLDKAVNRQKHWVPAWL